MPNYSTNLKTWGSTGQEYPDNYSYVEGEQPVDAWDNFIMTNVINDIEHLINVTNNDLLASDGSVNLQADLSDDQGNTIWDYSLQKVPAASQEASSITVSAGDGLKDGGSLSNQGGSTTLNIEPADFAGSGLQDDGSNNLEVDTSSVATRSWVNSNADVPNANYADSAGNADTLDGNHASEFTTSTDLNNHENDSDAHHASPTVYTEAHTIQPTDGVWDDYVFQWPVPQSEVDAYTVLCTDGAIKWGRDISGGVCTVYESNQNGVRVFNSNENRSYDLIFKAVSF